MPINFVFIDYENIQPKDLGCLKDGPFKVKFFLGSNQLKLPVALAAAVQSLGNDAEYIPLEAAGKNALDFHIAYYVGSLSAENPSAHFHVISKDTGFDPLMRHLKKKGVSVQRSTSIMEMPYFKSTLKAAAKAQVEAVVADLIRRNASKPRTRKTLLSTMSALFKKELSEFELSYLFDVLCRRGIVKLEGSKVTYELPSEP